MRASRPVILILALVLALPSLVQAQTTGSIVGHVSDAERVFGYRAFCISRGEQTSLPGFDENQYVARSPAFECRLARTRLPHNEIIHVASGERDQAAPIQGLVCPAVSEEVEDLRHALARLIVGAS